MSTKKPKVKPTDQFIEDNTAAISAAVDVIDPQKNDRGHRLTVRVSEELYERIWAARDKGRLSMAAVVIAALEDYLPKEF